MVFDPMARRDLHERFLAILAGEEARHAAHLDTIRALRFPEDLDDCPRRRLLREPRANTEAELWTCPQCAGTYLVRAGAPRCPRCP